MLEQSNQRSTEVSRVMQAQSETATQHSNLDEEDLLLQMVNVIARESSPEAIILFGSRARRDARADSGMERLLRNVT